MKTKYLLTSYLLFSAVFIHAQNSIYPIGKSDFFLNQMSKTVDKLNRHYEEVMNHVYEDIEKAGKALEEKNYHHALYLFENALSRLQENGYGRDGSKKELYDNLEMAIKNCKYKIENPDDNPFYRTEIGWLKLPFNTFRNVYGIGEKDRLSFIAIELGNIEWFMLPQTSIDKFEIILNDLENCLTKLKTKKISLSQVKEFPTSFWAYSSDMKNNKGFSPKSFDIDIVRNKQLVYVASIRLNGNPIMVFESSDIQNLTNFKSAIMEARQRYGSSRKEKVKDNDYIIKIMSTPE